MQRAIEHAKELHALMHQVELQTAKEGTEGTEATPNSHSCTHSWPHARAL